MQPKNGCLTKLKEMYSSKEVPPLPFSCPIGFMYGIFIYIYHNNQPNIGNHKYTIPMDPMGVFSIHRCFWGITHYSLLWTQWVDILGESFCTFPSKLLKVMTYIIKRSTSNFPENVVTSGGTQLRIHGLINNVFA